MKVLDNEYVTNLYEHQHASAHPVLVEVFHDLVLVADKLDYRVHLQRSPARRDPGSEHRKDTKRIWLDPGPYPPSRLGLVCSFAHELGHIHDPPLSTDDSLSGPELAQRTLEREAAAWDWAKRYLENTASWTELQEHFRRQARASISAYCQHFAAKGLLES